MDKDAYNKLLQSLSRVFQSLPSSLTESEDDEGDRADSDELSLPKKTTITIMTIGKSKGGTSMIPRMKADKTNDGSIGSGKRGSKGE